MKSDQNEPQLPLFQQAYPTPSADEQRIDILSLSHVKGLGEASIKALLLTFGNLSTVWDADPDLLLETLVRAKIKSGRNVVSQISNDRAQLRSLALRDLDRFEKQGIHLLTNLDKKFPDRLRGFGGAPDWIFVQGV